VSQTHCSYFTECCINRSLKCEQCLLLSVQYHYWFWSLEEVQLEGSDSLRKLSSWCQLIPTNLTWTCIPDWVSPCTVSFTCHACPCMSSVMLMCLSDVPLICWPHESMISVDMVYRRFYLTFFLDILTDHANILSSRWVKYNWKHQVQSPFLNLWLTGNACTEKRLPHSCLDLTWMWNRPRGLHVYRGL